MLRVICAALGLMVLFSVAVAEEKKDEKTPPEAVIKPLLQTQYGTSSVAPDGTPHYTYTLTYQSIKYGAPYEGTYRSDGVPPNTKTMVYPVKVDFLLTRIRNGNETEKKLEHIVGTYGFFKDSFGDWTFRIKDQQREDVKSQ